MRARIDPIGASNDFLAGFGGSGVAVSLTSAAGAAGADSTAEAGVDATAVAGVVGASAAAEPNTKG